jgi:hypothetical protein
MRHPPVLVLTWFLTLIRQLAEKEKMLDRRETEASSAVTMLSEVVLKDRKPSQRWGEQTSLS